MLCTWWDSKGFQLLKPGEIVISKLYKEQLQKLNQKIQEMGPHNARTARKVLLLHNNTKQYVALATKVAISELGWKPLPYPAYSPDLAPSDHYLFRSVLHSLSEQTFKNEECIDFLITSKEESFCCKSIHKVPEKWAKVIDFNDDYFEE